MKRLIIALAVVAAVAAVGFGAAAALPAFTPDHLAAGNADVVGPTAIGSVQWKTFTSYDGTPSGYGFKVAGIQINGLVGADGDKVLVALWSAPGAQIGFARGTVAGSVATVNQFYKGGVWSDGTSGSGPWAKDVNQISILIKGSWVSYDGP
jgi:hypothetical protein